jgi:hypothetical protein
MKRGFAFVVLDALLANEKAFPLFFQEKWSSIESSVEKVNERGRPSLGTPLGLEKHDVILC